MVYTEIQTKQGKKYYYRTLTIREDGKFRKFRVYLGAELSEKELKEKEKEANYIIHSQSGKIKKINSTQALDELKRIKWMIYHDRATMIPILTGSSLFDIFSTGLVPLFGDSYNHLLVIYREGRTVVCFPEIKSNLLGKIAFKQLKQDTKLIQKYKDLFKIKSIAFLKHLKSISKKFNDNISNKDIMKFYNGYYKEYNDVGIWGEPFPLVVYNELYSYLEKVITKGIKDKKERLELFTLLVTPAELSFVSREEKELHTIAKKINKNKRLKELFKSAEHIILDELKDFPDIYAELVNHSKKYFWVAYDYIGDVWDVDYFVKRIKELLESPKSMGRDFDGELRKIKERQEKAFGMLIRNKIITKEDKELFLAAQHSTMMMDYKKEVFNQAHYYINKLLLIAAKRSNLTLKEMVYAYRNDLPKLLSKKMNSDIIRERAKRNAYYFSNKGMCIFTGKNVDDILAFLESGYKGQVKEVSGICANPGTIIGRAKLLMVPSEINKIKKGDILVTGMTTPEYVPAMKRASAIITNEGGVTCHAAIISRELGIPCVVGTKNATKVLKDDDLIELHAGNGIIKLLKRSK